MQYYIDGVDFHNQEVMFYHQLPSSWETSKKQATIKELILSGDWLGSRKMDGAFYKFLKDEDGNMELIGRNRGVDGEYNNKILWVPQFSEYFNSLPNGTCLIGELYLPSAEGSNNTTTIMGCLLDKAIERQQEGEYLDYYIFDVLAYNNKSFLSLNAATRFEFLQSLPICNYVHTAQYFKGEELYKLIQELFNDGAEGAVITRQDALYQPGKRPTKTTLKIKRELANTIDCVVMGMSPPTKEYSGKNISTWKYWIDDCGIRLPLDTYTEDGKHFPVTKAFYNDWAGSLLLGLYDTDKNEITVFGELGGLTDKDKEEWKDHLNKCVEVSAMELYSDTHAMRHPRFVRWRDDKTPNQCTWEQVYDN